MILIIILTFIFLLIWLVFYILANDFSIPTKQLESHLSKVKKVMIIFPHADDECLGAGGLMTQLARMGKKLYWVVLTKGERGTKDASVDENLKIIRTNEARAVAKIYNVRKLSQFDFGDNRLENNQSQVTLSLKREITAFSPDLIITYDQSGLYGHPDHIITSKVVTHLVNKYFSNTRLWYVSYPQKILNKISLPEHMANSEIFRKKRSFPTIKIHIGLIGLIKKIVALYSYRSQLGSFSASKPIKFIPLWFYIAIMPYEHFHEVN